MKEELLNNGCCSTCVHGDIKVYPGGCYCLKKKQYVSKNDVCEAGSW